MLYTIENDYLRAQIKDDGAELHSLYGKQQQYEYLWQGDPAVWYGQAPVLFPIIGRLLNDQYRYGGKTYVMQKHGFARKRTFSVVSCAHNEALFLLKSDDATREMYPFEFELYVRFELLGNSLRATHTVVNRDDKEIFFSLGGHPGFNCAIGARLEFDEPETLNTRSVDVNDALLLPERKPVLQNEKSITITEHIFDQDALILSGMRSRAVTLVSDAHPRRVRFTFGDVPNLGIWAKPGAPYVCIEPWCGLNDDHTPRNDISEKEAIIRLPAGDMFDLVYTAEIF